MKNWHKYGNYRKYKNADGSITYCVIIDGKKVNVSKEIYQEYASASRKMKYMELDLKRDRVLQDANGKAVTDENGLPIILPEREVSLDKLFNEEWDFPQLTASPEEATINAFEREEVRRCVALLDKQDQSLVHALFYDGMTETQYAALIGISQPAVSKRRKAILSKLKKIINI